MRSGRTQAILFSLLALTGPLAVLPGCNTSGTITSILADEYQSCDTDGSQYKCGATFDVLPPETGTLSVVVTYIDGTHSVHVEHNEAIDRILVPPGSVFVATWTDVLNPSDVRGIFVNDEEIDANTDHSITGAWQFLKQYTVRAGAL